MITFSTFFPLNGESTVERFAELTSTWLAGSPHSNISDLLPTAAIEDDWEAIDTDEQVEAHKVVMGDSVLFGLRYVKDESSGMRWITEVNFASTSEGNFAAVTVHVDSDSTALRLPSARKPYIVRQIVSEFGNGSDGELVVSDEPYYLKATEIDFAAEIVNGDCGNTLPIVYLSSFADDRFSVNPEQLAHWLSGVAHVVVEPNREFSFRLAIEVDHRNTYGGAVGIYWPDRDVRSLILPREFDFDQKLIAAEISRIIRDRAVHLRTPRNLTWSNLQECHARARFEKLRKSGSRDLEEYIATFDRELRAKEDSISNAESEIRRLEAEVRSLRERTKSMAGDPVLIRGTEPDLYKDESLAFVVNALRHECDSSSSESRKHHLLSSLVAANPVEDFASEYSDRVKSLLSDYRTLESSIAHELEEIGFEITSDGKHHKLIFRGDSRYQVSMSKTSSDHRAGKNLVSEINRKLF
jgi:hypothetical protein